MTAAPTPETPETPETPATGRAEQDRRWAISWPLTDGDLTLRPARLDDAEAMLDYQRLPECQRYVNRTVATLDDARAVLQARIDEEDTLVAAVELAGEVVGDIGGRRSHPFTMGPPSDAWDCSLGYTIHPRLWGRGLASRAVALLLPALHGQAGIRRVQAMVFGGNDPSVRVLLKNGFVHEGTARRIALGRDGEWLDDHTLSHFADDPRPGADRA